MLVLSRKLGEKIVIGDNIVVTVVKIDRNQIRIGIEAPHDVPVYREEIAPQRAAQAGHFRGGRLESMSAPEPPRVLPDPTADLRCPRAVAGSGIAAEGRAGPKPGHRRVSTSRRARPLLHPHDVDHVIGGTPNGIDHAQEAGNRRKPGVRPLAPIRGNTRIGRRNSGELGHREGRRRGAGRVRAWRSPAWCGTVS